MEMHIMMIVNAELIEKSMYEEIEHLEVRSCMLGPVHTCYNMILVVAYIKMWSTK